MSAVPLSEFKRHIGATTSREDAEMQQTLDAAEEWAALYIGAGAALGIGTRTMKVHPNGTNLVLPATRLASVVSVTDPDGATVTLDADNDINLLSGIVRVPYRRAGAWTVEATFPTEIPASIAWAVVEIAKHLWETQRVSGQDAGVRPGFGAAPTPSGGSTGYAIPNRAKTLLGPYRQVPVA